MPVILEIWKYFPDNKGLTTSLALSGFGFIQLLFEDISINIINYEKHSIDYIDGIYSAYTNNNFKQYFKLYNIFLSVLSVLSIIIMYPHDKYKKYLRRSVNKYNYQYKNLINTVNENDDVGNNDEVEFI
jgi:hypothetical protein